MRRHGSVPRPQTISPTLSHSAASERGAIPPRTVLMSQMLGNLPAGLLRANATLPPDRLAVSLLQSPRHFAHLLIPDRMPLDSADRHHLHDRVRQKHLVRRQQVLDRERILLRLD